MSIFWTKFLFLGWNSHIFIDVIRKLVLFESYVCGFFSLQMVQIHLFFEIFYIHQNCSRKKIIKNNISKSVTWKKPSKTNNNKKLLEKRDWIYSWNLLQNLKLSIIYQRQRESILGFLKLFYGEISWLCQRFCKTTFVQNSYTCIIFHGQYVWSDFFKFKKLILAT